MSLLPQNVRIAHPERLFIAGQWVEGGGPGIAITSPETETVIARVGEATGQDMDAAAEAAHAAFTQDPWPATPVAKRAELLRAIADGLEARRDELARAWTAQIGGLASFAPVMVAMGIEHFRNAAALAETFDFETEESIGDTAVALVVHEPVGVVAAIAPWNAPFGILCAKVAPALLAGCTVVMKPAPETPLEAYILAEVAEAAGLPPGVLNLVPAHRESADYLVRHPLVDKVSFTGSTAAGSRIASVCGERIARCSLELGGKSAAIVLDDFPIDKAAKLLARAITAMSGQICSILSRALVSRARHDELAAAIADEMRRIRIGYADDPDSEMGPLAMGRQLERVEQYIRTGIAEGATLVTGGRRPEGLAPGYFIEPTLFANVDSGMTIAQEEIFGPVLVLIPYDDLDHAVSIANDSAYGLNGAILTNDPAAALALSRRVRTGSIGQNGMRGPATLPFGGYKRSGVGRERGAEGLMAYLETKVITLERLPAESVG